MANSSRSPLKNLLAAFAVSLAVACTAQASSYRTTVNGTTYDFTTITGRADANQTLLSAQPWFGNVTLATDFAAALGANLGGTVNFNELGPMFAYAVDGTGFSFAAYAFGSIVTPVPYTSKYSFTFAIAQAVPQQVPEIDGALLPQALVLMGAATFFIRRRR